MCSQTTSHGCMVWSHLLTSICLNGCAILILSHSSQQTSWHNKGSENTAADTLLWFGELHQSQFSVLIVDFKALVIAQQNYQELDKLKFSFTFLIFKTVPLSSSHTPQVCVMSTVVPHPFMPTKLCCAVFDSLHSLSHPGVHTTQKLLATCYVWTGVNTDVRNWAHTCAWCQQSKIHGHIPVQVSHKISSLLAVWTGINIDVGNTTLVHGVKHSKVHRHTTALFSKLTTPDASLTICTLTLQDHSFHPIATYTCLLLCWLLAKGHTHFSHYNTLCSLSTHFWMNLMFGKPSSITTDRSCQFESSLCENWCTYRACNVAEQLLTVLTQTGLS